MARGGAARRNAGQARPQQVPGRTAGDRTGPTCG